MGTVFQIILQGLWDLTAGVLVNLAPASWARIILVILVALIFAVTVASGYPTRLPSIGRIGFAALFAFCWVSSAVVVNSPWLSVAYGRQPLAFDKSPGQALTYADGRTENSLRVDTTSETSRQYVSTYRINAVETGSATGLALRFQQTVDVTSYDTMMLTLHLRYGQARGSLVLSDLSAGGRNGNGGRISLGVNGGVNADHGASVTCLESDETVCRVIVPLKPLAKLQGDDGRPRINLRAIHEIGFNAEGSTDGNWVSIALSDVSFQ